MCLINNFQFFSTSGDSSSNWQWNSTTSTAKNQDQEENSTPKKSVLTKVKEKAKKLKHTLSGRKKNDSATPSWGLSLDDEEEDDEDPEYLGAPSNFHITFLICFYKFASWDKHGFYLFIHDKV